MFPQMLDERWTQFQMDEIHIKDEIEDTGYVDYNAILDPPECMSHTERSRGERDEDRMR